MFGWEEYLYNTTYLELNWDIMWWLVALPYITAIYSFMYIPFVGAWAIISYFINAAFQFGAFQEAEMKLAYARKLGDKLGFGIGGKFIYSDLASNQTVQGQTISVGLAGAVDISATYMDEIEIGNRTSI